MFYGGLKLHYHVVYTAGKWLSGANMQESSYPGVNMLKHQYFQNEWSRYWKND